ncbi:MAG: amidohydrolase family protein [Anaerovoracaceae bacterium]
MLIIQNARLLGPLTEGYDGQFADLWIEDGVIREIRPEGWNPGCSGMVAAKRCGIPEGAQIVDAAHHTVMPGLIDMHAHVYLKSLDFAKIKDLGPADSVLNAYIYAREYLKAGYTTVRDCGCMYNVTVAIQDAPRLISCGQILTPTETGNDTFGELYIEADGPDQVRAAARKQFKLKNDFIKYMVTGAFLNEKGSPGMTIAALDELKAAVEIAEMKESYVCGHAHGTAGIKRAIEAGIRTIEHGVFIDDECIDLLQKKADRCFLVPTGAITLACAGDTENMSANMQEKAEQYFEEERNNINHAYEAGLKLGFGSDLDMENFIANIGYEFTARTDYYHFKPMDILLQATKNSAEILMLEDEIGTVKAGKCADLIITDGNPDEDICVMNRPLLHVIRGGKIIY